MPWFRVDDSFAFNPKVLMAEGRAPGAISAWVRMGSYCAANLTDGHIPPSVALAIASQGQIDALVAVRFLYALDGGYQIHDYLKYQPSKDEVERDRAAARERIRNKRNNKPDVRANFGRTPSEGVPDGRGSVSGSEIRKVDFRKLQDAWITATGNIGTGQLSDLAVRCEEHAPLIGMEPNEYAARFCATFAKWVASCTPGKRPSLSANKAIEHFERIHGIVSGKSEIVKAEEIRPADDRPRPKPLPVHGDGSQCYGDCERENCDSWRGVERRKAAAK